MLVPWVPLLAGPVLVEDAALGAAPVVAVLDADLSTRFSSCEGRDHLKNLKHLTNGTATSIDRCSRPFYKVYSKLASSINHHPHHHFPPFRNQFHHFGVIIQHYIIHHTSYIMIYPFHHFAIELTSQERECVRNILHDICLFQSLHDNLHIWKKSYELPPAASAFDTVNGERVVKCIRRTLQREKFNIPVQLSYDGRAIVCIIPGGRHTVPSCAIDGLSRYGSSRLRNLIKPEHQMQNMQQMQRRSHNRRWS